MTEERGGRRRKVRARASSRRAATSVMLLMATLTLAAGCGHRATFGTSGDKLNVCDGVFLYDRLDEPDPSDHRSVLRYANDFAAIVHQVDFTQRYKDPKGKFVAPPAQVRTDYKTVGESINRFRDSIRAATKTGGASASASTDLMFKRAQAALAADLRFSEADKRLQEFLVSVCRYT